MIEEHLDEEVSLLVQLALAVVTVGYLKVFAQVLSQYGNWLVFLVEIGWRFEISLLSVSHNLG